MYERFYGLRERPFDLTPNPRFLFLTRQHQEALTHLQCGISQRKGITMVLGPAGTGKTTLIRAALANYAGTNARCVYLNNPTLTRDEFVQMLASGFELSDEASRSKAALLLELETKLRERQASGVVTALIVDEAQALSDQLLEEVRLLVNFETDTDKLLPVVLVGQGELATRLSDPACSALKQRIALRCELMPLTATETAQYVAARVRIAGGVPAQLFTREAIDLVYERSAGIPRAISVICDNALVTGFAVEQRPVNQKLILEVCRDFDFGDGSAPAALARAAAARESHGAEPHANGNGAPELAGVAPAVSEGAASERQLFGVFDRSLRSWFSRSS